MEARSGRRRRRALAVLAMTAAMVVGSTVGPALTAPRAGAAVLGGGGYPFFWDDSNVPCHRSNDSINGAGGYSYIFGYPTEMTCPFPHVYGLVGGGRVWQYMEATGFESTGERNLLPVDATWIYSDCPSECYPVERWHVWQGTASSLFTGLSATAVKGRYSYIELTTRVYFPVTYRDGTRFRIYEKNDWYYGTGEMHSDGVFRLLT